MSFKHRYDLPVSESTVLDYDTELVDQSEAKMCGLRYQLSKFGLDGTLSQLELQRSKFGYADTRVIPDFQTLQNKIADSTEYFNSLPSAVRRQFGDKPSNFYRFIEKHPVDSVKSNFISKEYAIDILGVSRENFETKQELVEPVSEVSTNIDSAN